MTRKDYILLAEAIRIPYLAAAREARTTGGVGSQDKVWAITVTASEIADALGRDNSRFDREHFLAVVRGEKDINSRPAQPRCSSCGLLEKNCACWS